MNEIDSVTMSRHEYDKMIFELREYQEGSQTRETSLQNQINDLQKVILEKLVKVEQVEYHIIDDNRKLQRINKVYYGPENEAIILLKKAYEVNKKEMVDRLGTALELAHARTQGVQFELLELQNRNLWDRIRNKQ